MSEWKSVLIELPPEDGVYLVCADIARDPFPGAAEYDGYGFKRDDIYRDNANFWDYMPIRVKRYGKL